MVEFDHHQAKNTICNKQAANIMYNAASFMFVWDPTAYSLCLSVKCCGYGFWEVLVEKLWSSVH
jgi:hypothetical protein